MSEAKKLPPEDFRKLQLLELDCLIELDRVCRKNNIPYVIYCGTLLGAVRHRGFIPWDDDLDVAMLREDYERFRLIADQLNPKICFLQDHRLDPNYLWGHSKLRRTGTIFVRAGQEHLKYKTGVCIDVFPLDDLPENPLIFRLKKFHCYCLRKIFWSRVAVFDKKKNWFWKLWWKCVSKFPIELAENMLLSYALESRNDSPNEVAVLTGAGSVSWVGMPKEWFRDRVEYEFEGRKFFGPRDYHGLLTLKYGENYMQPPPDKEITQHPVSIYKFDVD